MEKVNNPQQVPGESEKQKESILSYLALKNDQALHELQAQICSYQKEIELLKSEINVLEQSADQPDQFLAFASSQSKKTAQIIKDAIDHEFAGIEDEARMINDRHKQKIMNLDTKMQQGIKSAYKLMNDMLEKTNTQKTPTQETKNVTIKETADQEVKAVVQPSNIDMKQPVYQDVPPVMQPDNNGMKQPVLPKDVPVEKAGNVKIIEGFWDEALQEESEAKRETETTVQKDVAGLKNMYVIGKIAGEDLFDRSGKLIIAKNEIITQDVIEKAEREGNLIELVLEMKLQEG